MKDTTCQPHHSGKKLFFVLFLGACLAAGNALAGWFIAKGFYQSRVGDRYVSVKGSAERQVKADFAIWDVAYKASGDDLQQVNNQVSQNQKDVLAFLTKNGFANTDVEIQPTTVIDQYAQEYSSNKPQTRYIVSGGIRVRTDKVDQVRAVSQMSGELIKAGVVLAVKDYQPNPRYLFTKLDELRPEMLAQATKSAHVAAAQFAADSNSHVGAIRRASQGLFQILNGDSNAGQNTSSDTDQLAGINKTVRVVSSIDYSLVE